MDSTTRTEIHEPVSIGQRIADSITTFCGSGWFLLAHGMWWALWIGLHVEEYPYGLLTMILSLEAIVLATIIMISQNRQSDKDRGLAKKDDEELTLLLTLQQEQLELLRANSTQLNDHQQILKLLTDLQQRQMEILEGLGIDSTRRTRKSPVVKAAHS